jgi:hypothetical protein
MCHSISPDKLSEANRKGRALTSASARETLRAHACLHSAIMAARTAQFSRKTGETVIDVSLNLDCGPGAADAQVIDVSTGIGFLDHVRPRKLDGDIA